MKWYVSRFDYSTGEAEWKEARQFDAPGKAACYIALVAEDLEPGEELQLGCGEGDEDWYPGIE